MQRMSDEKLEQIAHTLAHLLANPILRSAYPSKSRGEMYELFKDIYKTGFKAGLKAEREKSQKLVEALSWALDSVCKHEGDSHQDTNRTWCLYCQSWVYKSDIENLKKAEAILKEYEKEGAE